MLSHAAVMRTDPGVLLQLLWDERGLQGKPPSTALVGREIMLPLKL